MSDVDNSLVPDEAPLADGPEQLVLLEPDRAQITIFAETVFAECEGLIPLRAFAEKGQTRQPAPETVWCPTDAQAIIRFVERAARSGHAAYVIPGTVQHVGEARAANIRQMRAVVADLDDGDIESAYTHLVEHLGPPSLVVESGGRTAEGQSKLHLWWKLTEPAKGADVERLCRLRGEIAAKAGGDLHFASAHQPIRIAAQFTARTASTASPGSANMQTPNTISATLNGNWLRCRPWHQIGWPGSSSNFSSKPSVDAVLTQPVREGYQDSWSRFQGASAAIGHYVRMVHDGRMSKDDGWEAICGYNAAMLRPPWPLGRLRAEAGRLWDLHVERHGPQKRAHLPVASTKSKLEAFTLGALLDDDREMPPDVIAPRVLTPGGLLVLGGAPKVGKSDFLISLLVSMAAGVPFLGFTPPRPLRIFYLQAEIQYDYLRERLKQMMLAPDMIAKARDTFVATPKLTMLLDADGMEQALNAIRIAFPTEPPTLSASTRSATCSMAVPPLQWAEEGRTATTP